MGAHVKPLGPPVVNRSPWDHYAACKVCGVEAGSPCLDLRRAVAGRFRYLRVQPHLPRALEDTYRGPLTWPHVEGEL
jgi:hypothetical protein